MGDRPCVCRVVVKAVVAFALALTVSGTGLAQLAPNGTLADKAGRSEQKVANEAAPIRAVAAPGMPSRLSDAQRTKSIILEQPGANRGVPPPNDNCANAQAIFGTGAVNFDNATALTDGPPHFLCTFFGGNQIDHDVWYLWTAPNTASFTLSTCGGSFLDTKIAVYMPGCPVSDASLIVCNDDACGSQSLLSFSATAGQQFLFRIGVFPGTAGGMGSFTIDLQPGQDVCGQPVGNCQPGANTDAFDASGLLVYDDFRPLNNGFITTVCFAGTFFDGLTNCENGTINQFRIRYIEDLAGFPNGPVIAEFFSGAGLQLTGPIATGETVLNQFPVFKFVGTHAPVPVTAGQCYWIQIFNETTGITGCNWFWRKGTGGNNIAFQTPFNIIFSTDMIATDLDFCLDIPLDNINLCQTSTPPVNDQCAGAVTLAPGTSRRFQNLFATESLTDPPLSCHPGGPAPGLGTVWFKFTATDPTALLSTCRSHQGDAMLAVYSGTCGNLFEIACNDDFCSLRPQITLTSLVPGQTYFVQFASLNPVDKGFYEITFDSPLPTVPPNDVCSGAVPITVAPGGFGFSSSVTDNATLDLDVPACGFAGITAPGIWFKVDGTGETLTASLCNSSLDFDTKMNVYCGTSCSELVCVGHNDDSCGINASLTWCSAVGQTYYILVWGFDGQIGTASILIQSDGVACATPPDCATCTLVCPPNAVLEAEPCGQSLNDGCNLAIPAFEPIVCGQTVCGNAVGISTQRDTDWYEFTISTQSLVTWAAQAELPVELFILDTQCIPQANILASTQVARCGSGSVQMILDPGTYRLFIANITDAYPCGTSNRYLATFTCEPIGACCFGTDCAQTTLADCQQRGGQYGGGGSICATTYPATPCSSAFEDIRTTGTPLNLPDNGGQSVNIGFVFRFFGVESSTIGISADGFLSANTNELVAPQNVAIPTPGAPEAVIAPLWTNYSPSVAGFVHVQTLGIAPNRRFIAQWSSLPRFLAGGSNTFQVVLFEGTNCIEFRYGAFDPPPSPGTYTVGVENFDGSVGTSIDPATLSPGSCIRLCPVVDPAGCQRTGCPGDANADGSVNFADITAIVANWGGTGPIGDPNHDGVVNFADITAVVAGWGCTSVVCPGDANGDLLVNFADITSVVSNWGGPGPNGDANFDRIVNFADITAIVANWSNVCLAF